MRILLLLLIICMTCLQSNASETYQVNAPKGLNVRDFPSKHGKVKDLLKDGRKVEVSNIYEGWAQITYDGKMGYVSMDYLMPYAPVNAAAGKTDSRPHGPAWIPIAIVLLAVGSGYLLGHDYTWCGVVGCFITLLLTWYQLEGTPWPLWFVTEKGVGIGWMLINMFLMLFTIYIIWLEITLILKMLGVDDVTVWGAKGLFILRIFSPVPFLTTLLILWALGSAIYRSIRQSNFFILGGVAAGLLFITVLVNGGGALCEEKFHGFDAFILIAGICPTVLQIIGSFGEGSSTSSSDELAQYEVYDASCNRRRTLTQTSKYSGCNFRDEDGNDWENINGNFHKRNY